MVWVSVLIFILITQHASSVFLYFSMLHQTHKHVATCFFFNFQVRRPCCVLYDQYMCYKIIKFYGHKQLLVIRSISCVSSYMFRLMSTAIFRLVFGIVCVYSCWCFENTNNCTYKPLRRLA